MDASPVSMMPSGCPGSARLAARSQSSATAAAADKPMMESIAGFWFAAAFARFAAER
jgi:hypothetical protein